MKETEEQRAARMTRNQAVYNYIDARIKSDAAERAAETARIDAAKAVNEMQQKWREVLKHNPPTGVYSFKEHCQTCIVVTGGDYPPLTQVRL